ncbi:MAG: tRNA lysidine(34) synthetase TilS [Nitrospira sp.]|nr:tRNA lysidine(34) synthetase TilS [Nitrospira sp.]
MPMVEQRVSRKAWPPLLHRVVKTVRARGLFEPGHHLLIALSGGPDSVALLTLLHRLIPRWRVRLTAVHFNYGLRGQESDEDQAFVASLCDALQVPLRCVPLDARTRLPRVSLQAQARDMRYRAMARLAEDIGVDRIAIGHTADDQAETILLWMLRGAGITGLAGMPVQRDGMIIRPLYEVRRREVLDFLHAARQAYRQDSSNAKPVYARNRIRHQLIPVLNQVAPAAVDALCRMGDVCREDDRYLEELTVGLCDVLVQSNGAAGYSIDRRGLQAQPLALQRRVLREVFRRMHSSWRVPSLATVEVVRRLLSFTRGEARHCAGGVQVRVTPNALLLQPAQVGVCSQESQTAAERYSVQIPSIVEWAGTRQRIRVQEETREAVHRLAASAGWRMVVDADLLSYPLHIRSWKAGDRFVPSGMKGRSKKLQDYFMDLKIPASQRRKIPILDSPQGIVGVLGFRQDERFQVSDRTRRYVVASIDEMSGTEGVH